VINGGGATITNNGTVAFEQSSTAGTATINNNGTLGFLQTSSAGNATINNIAGRSRIEFLQNSTAGNAQINNSGIVRFIDNSTAGTATIVNDNSLLFSGASTAGNATITNNANLGFLGTSTAGNADITNTRNISFSASSTAGNATIDNSGIVFFVGNSTGGNAAIDNKAGGTVDFSGSTGPAGNGQLTAGSLAGAGSFFLGANQLTVGGNNHSTEVTGVISDCGPTGTECRAPNQLIPLPSTGGSLVKTGTGALTLSGANTYTGPTWVNQGVLTVNGSLVSDVTVTNGALLDGTGSVGATTVNGGGTIAPGNSIGTMTVNGNFNLKSGAVYEVEANAAGQSDKVVVKGAVNLTGATLRVLEAGGAYKPKTDYVIIDNDGTDAVQGQFAQVSNALAFLTPVVLYDGGTGNDVVLTLVRKNNVFSSVAATGNQEAVAKAVERAPTDNDLFLSVLNQTIPGAREAFNALSGEVHATVSGTLVDDSRYAREAVLGRMMQASHQGGALGSGGPQVASLDNQAYSTGYDGKSLVEVPQPHQPLAFWTEGYGAFGWFGGDGNAAKADRNLGGFISGMDAHVGGSWRVGLATGASFSDVSVDKRYSGANTQTYHLGGYVGGDVGGFALRGGGLWAWTDIETSRAVAFPNFYERQRADYDADTGQLFGEIAYPTQMGGVELEPFAGLAFVSVESGGFREKGGPQASLRTSGFDQDVGYTTVGLRAAQTMMWGAMAVTPHIEAAWLHAFDDVTPGASLAFATTGLGFAIDGVPIAEDSAILDAGVDFAVSERLTAGVSYTGQYAEKFSDNGVKGRFTWLF
jgi:autotransporter-associated beta strand protein